jgi:hypothetical protein
MDTMPQCPSMRRFHVRRTPELYQHTATERRALNALPIPNGVTKPRPVTTTRCIAFFGWMLMMLMKLAACCGRMKVEQVFSHKWLASVRSVHIRVIARFRLGHFIPDHEPLIRRNDTLLLEPLIVYCITFGYSKMFTLLSHVSSHNSKDTYTYAPIISLTMHLRRGLRGIRRATSTIG